MALIGGTNEEKIWRFLKTEGFSDYAVSGIMGNLFAESNLNPINLQNTYEKKLGYSDKEYCDAVDQGKYSDFIHDNAAFGLAQWKHKSRKQGLLEYAQSLNCSIGDLEMQLKYLIKELNGSYKNILPTLQSAKSIREASDVMLIKFENPSNKSKSVQEKRASYGQKYFEQFADDVIDGEFVKDQEVFQMRIKVKDILRVFENMYAEHWSYVWGVAKYGCVDCSGAFVYAYKTLSNGELSIYHGSNRIARKYVGKLQSIDKAKAGYAAFKWKKDGEPDSYTDNLGNFYHIGLVDASGKYVLNAKSESKGFCKDSISSWDYVAPLNAVDYSEDTSINNANTNSNKEEIIKPIDAKYFAYVDTTIGNLNLRKEPDGKKIGTIPRTVLVDVLNDDNEDWWYVRYDQAIGYASSKFLMKLDTSRFPYDVKVTTSSLNMRSGAGKNYDKIGTIRNGGTYTVVDESDGIGASKWGKLKFNGAWISLDYTERV